jgi:hypothetical protein
MEKFILYHSVRHIHLSLHLHGYEDVKSGIRLKSFEEPV